MSSDPVDSKHELMSAIVVRLKSPVLLFSLAIALVIGGTILGNDGDPILSVGAVLVVFMVGVILHVFFEKPTPPQEPHASPSADPVIASNDPGQIAEDKSKLSEIRNAGSDKLAVEVWVTPKNGSDKRDNFAIGDKIRICVRASENCYLTLLNIGSDGELTVLFPNQRHRENRIEKSRTYRIPEEDYQFDFNLEGPEGVDVVKAIVTLDSKPLLETDFDRTGNFFHSVASTAAPRAIKVIAREVEERTDDSWAAASTHFIIANR